VRALAARAPERYHWRSVTAKLGSRVRCAGARPADSRRRIVNSFAAREIVLNRATGPHESKLQPRLVCVHRERSERPLPRRQVTRHRRVFESHVDASGNPVGLHAEEAPLFQVAREVTPVIKCGDIVAVGTDGAYRGVSPAVRAGRSTPRASTSSLAANVIVTAQAVPLSHGACACPTHVPAIADAVALSRVAASTATGSLGDATKGSVAACEAGHAPASGGGDVETTGEAGAPLPGWAPGGDAEGPASLGSPAEAVADGGNGNRDRRARQDERRTCQPWRSRNSHGADRFLGHVGAVVRAVIR